MPSTETKRYLLDKILSAVLMGDIEKADRFRAQYLGLEGQEVQIESELADFHANHYWAGDITVPWKE